MPSALSVGWLPFFFPCKGKLNLHVLRPGPPLYRAWGGGLVRPVSDVFELVCTGRRELIVKNWLLNIWESRGSCW